MHYMDANKTAGEETRRQLHIYIYKMIPSFLVTMFRRTMQKT